MPDLYLVEFKGHRRELFYNTFYHSLKMNDYVIVQAERGEDAGILKCKVQQDISSTKTEEKPRSILRPASDEDKKNIKDNFTAEDSLWDNARKLIEKHKLEMKLVDIEYQFDRNKLTFFFTADHRVDFRALVRDLAAEYKTRIELRQIGVRDEAKRLGGYGVCGLRLCCASFLQNFEPISTQDARVQGLSLNPSKISGNCGRLLCCLKYEVDYYASIRSKYPEIGEKYRTEKGEGIVERIDVFEDYMVVRHEFGEEEKIAGDELNNGNGKKTSPSGDHRESARENNNRKNNFHHREDTH
jgi:cell fate regulator YaaT (PSP1 superfamily)